jgi:hypothetical protein
MSYVPLALPIQAEAQEPLVFHGVPFQVWRKEGHLVGWRRERQDVPLDAPACQALFLLGMTTDRPECSEWWGQNERQFSHAKRVWIGDRLGQIRIVYVDRKMDVIPVIFGVNVWTYELFTNRQPNEKHLNAYGGPYPEPFAGDPAARALLEDSLMLRANDAEKPAKYILAVRTRPVGIMKLQLIRDEGRLAGFQIGAATGLLADAPAALLEGWRMVDNDFFLRKLYLPAMDKLARRLYQFADELPAGDPYDPPPGYAGPEVRLAGTPLAEVLANVYAHNLHDMATDKLDPRGMMHTSSSKAPNFSLYVGYGGFKRDAGSYYGHVWTRDCGRSATEVVASGERERTVKAAAKAHELLYDRGTRFDQPNWKRIGNASTLGNDKLLESVSGKENDGHAAMMLFVYRLFHAGLIDAVWLKDNRQAVVDAAEWFCWQMEHPEQSHFDRVLYSESEASTQEFGGYDLFSNAQAWYALRAYVRLAEAMGQTQLAVRWSRMAQRLGTGILDCFTTRHPRYGQIFVDTTYDCWTWESKALAPLFLAPDLVGYDLAALDRPLYDIARNTYRALWEEYPRFAQGRQMGYGQGYITQGAILCDQYEHMQGFLEQAAAFCYHHSDYNYIVPEGVICHPSGRFWFRNCDLGNSVQQAEIVKSVRLILGVDDLEPSAGLRLIPRLPAGWRSLSASRYPAVVVLDDQRRRVTLDLRYERVDGGYRLTFQADCRIPKLSVRMGPFPEGAPVKLVGLRGRPEPVDRDGLRFVYLAAGNVPCLDVTARQAPGGRSR